MKLKTMTRRAGILLAGLLAMQSAGMAQTQVVGWGLDD